jgi:hypothetical protein
MMAGAKFNQYPGAKPMFPVSFGGAARCGGSRTNSNDLKVRISGDHAKTAVITKAND